MAGIYLHVPFCKVKCHYCDFHFSVQLKNRKKLVQAMVCEIELRKKFLENEPVSTIYFGGGTPSILEIGLIQDLLNVVSKNFQVDTDCEITLECNPDDLDEEKLRQFHALGVNRLSIGIQSFNDEVLTFMNRSHNAGQAKKAVQIAHKTGFENLTIDLIYGVPGSTLETWKEELNQMNELGVPHLSSYCLTIEENTVFGNWHKKGKLNLFPDDESLSQFQYLMDFAKENGYEQYEISNFAKDGFISRHNSAYWKGKNYLGIGPSAHSYNGQQRGWNIANNMKYLKCLAEGKTFYEFEELSVRDKFNDYLLTRLRTKWGLELDELRLISEQMTEKIRPELNRYVGKKQMAENGICYTLTDQGKYMADAIAADLFQ